MYKLQRRNGSRWITLTSAIPTETAAFDQLNSSRRTYNESLRIVDKNGSVIYTE